MNRNEKILAIVGPTASGKTRRAVAAALALSGEIISADSRQVYRGMDIGTGKDLEEYGDVAAHLLDVADAGEVYTLYNYLDDASRAIDDIQSRGHVAVMCGGTGLYAESLLRGVVLPEVPANPALRASLEGKSIDKLAQILGSLTTLHNVTDLDSTRRAIRAIEIQTYLRDHPDAQALTRPAAPRPSVVIGVDIPRDDRRQRIASRLRARLEQGMVEEVRGLLDRGVAQERLLAYGLEYRFLTLYLTGQITEKEMTDGLYTAICQFAKRQMTWFRGMERRGIPIHWLPYDLEPDEFTRRVVDLYQ